MFNPHPFIRINTIKDIYKGGIWMFQACNAMNSADIYPLVTNLPNGYVMNSRTYQHLSVNPAGQAFASR
ncbi:MAG: hypothetical protein JAZ03_20050, partial [Candidatus Thiodiazotropha taylori]|nr:hypothetical protein [Candidatus Thiodiazotropha taylori]MCW4336222.1 hypothetical protein [Candidatus Thiodiazotropha endolucinida]